MTYDGSRARMKLGKTDASPRQVGVVVFSQVYEKPRGEYSGQCYREQHMFIADLSQLKKAVNQNERIIRSECGEWRTKVLRAEATPRRQTANILKGDDCQW